MRIFGANERIEYLVRITPEEVISRLASAVDEEQSAMSLSGYAGDKEIIGKIDGRRFRLQNRRSYVNRSAPFLHGIVEDIDGNTKINAEFRMHPANTIWMIVVTAFLLFLFFLGVYYISTFR